MKRLFFYIVCCALASFVACSNNEDLGVGVQGNGSVVISTSVSDVVTRSDDNASESRVEWIDVFVFDANGNKFHSERINKSSNPDIGGGTLTISKSRSAFALNAEYSIYLIANSSTNLQQESIETLDKLKAQIQVDENLHLSGFRDADGNMIKNNAPALFLMDGVVHTPSNENQTSIVINNGNTNVDLQLEATIRRAAAKIVININQGKDVEFHHYLEITDDSGNVTDIGTAEYTFYQLPISTTILSSATPLTNPTKQNTTEEHDNDYSFIWSKGAGHTDAKPNHKIQLVGYSYAYKWDTAEDMVSLVVNIPMRWNENNSTSVTRDNWSKRSQNWYRIPITQSSSFDRNKLYEVSITINTAGASSKSSAIILQDIKYHVHDWEDKEISITNSANDPEFLMLNRDTVHIYNANIDTEQLSFSSSSFIPSNGIKVKSVSVNGRTKKAIYFYNKFGQKTYLQDVSGSSSWGVDSPSTVASAVNATAQANVLNGGITISSKIFEQNDPDTEWHFNTIRYIEFEVENADGIKAEFLVMQYPVIYITNQQGYYSYRDDFIAADGTVVNYQNRRPNYLTAAYWGSYKIQKKSGSNRWSDVQNSSGYGAVQTDQAGNYYVDGKKLTSQNRDYYYEYTEGGDTYRKIFSSIGEVFTSDVMTEYYSSGTNLGKAKLYEYKFKSSQDGWNTNTESKVPGNQRMYHVHVTATSSDYTVGRPRIVDENGNITTDVENGQTDDSADNARLVSPSFMIASQLGVTSSVSSVSDSNYARAVNQCKNYVETYYDDLNNNNKWDSGETVHHYKDWRLPTAEEIRIIAELQGKTNGAVDTVLAGKYYFCASPQKYVRGAGSGTDYYFIRCIRDAY